MSWLKDGTRGISGCRRNPRHARWTFADAIRKDLGAGANIETILTRIHLLQQALGPAQAHGLDSEGYMALGAEVCKKIGEVVGAPRPKERNAYTELVSWANGTMHADVVEIFTGGHTLFLIRLALPVMICHLGGQDSGSYMAPSVGHWRAILLCAVEGPTRPARLGLEALDELERT